MTYIAIKYSDIKVSIIMPCYNSLRYISEAIESVVTQSHTNWELLITDDCSTDETVELLKRYYQDDKRINIKVNQANSGPAVSRNNSIQRATGKYIAFLDSDDIWAPEKLTVQIQFMEKNQVGLSYADYESIDDNGRNLSILKSPPDKLSYTDMLKENQIGCLTGIYNQQMIGKNYMPLIKKRQDYGLWLSILKKLPCAYKTPGILAKYRVRDDSVSSSKLGLLKYNYNLFHEYEGLSIIRSSYYVGWNVYRKLKKLRKLKLIF